MKNIKIVIVVALALLIMPTYVSAETLYNTLKNGATKDNIASTYVSSSSGIDFSTISSDINGKGLYMVGSTASATYPIVYYRGDVTNNHVLYGGFCWQIVRTTKTGGIKLMYAGTPNNGKCTAEGEDLIIGKTAYNSVNNTPYYGWMYNTESGDVNVTNSTAKTYLDNWFANNMVDYQRGLEDTVWCNDRGMDDETTFTARTRLENGAPTFECVNQDDSFTVSSSNGNGKLTYPTGIINADELTYAGGVIKETQMDTYTNIDVAYWSMTPYAAAKHLFLTNKGMINTNSFTYSAGIRPMVSIKNSASITAGNGSKDNPYQITIDGAYLVRTDAYTTSDKSEAKEGDTVSLTHSDRSGFKFVSYKITDMSDNELSITVTNGKFTMPKKDVKVSSIYRELKDFHNVTTTDSNISIVESSVEEDQAAVFSVNVPRGFKLKSVKLLDTSGNELNIQVENRGNNTYAFTMPTQDVVIDAELEALDEHTVKGDVEGLDNGPYYEGDKVSFKVKAKANYKVSKVYLTDDDGNVLDIEVTENNGVYSFVMPDKNVKINVEYVKDGKLNPQTSDIIFKNIVILFLSLSGLIYAYTKKESFSK